ncbi:hypothetical protein jhhlp_005632 [Lomentospora prolificans]|uniref:Pentacotripeptide-repeat region of PRORP domain-containing protein n=1 Tax=Lomentospora prolificans TaxID=41688 RepID=A0A2N3N3N1_9PEZI|nr:hypothetical protein jhhlp_005632 [Lomentospora prolificans]
MRVPSRLDGSICVAILSARPAVVSSSSRSVQQRRDNSSRNCQTTHDAAPRRLVHPRHRDTCAKTTAWLRSTFLSPLFAPENLPSTQRGICSSARHRSPASAAAIQVVPPSPPIDFTAHQFTKDELLSLVDQQNVGPVEEYIQFHQDPYLRRYPQPDGPHLRVSDREEDSHYPSREQAVEGNKQVEQISDQLLWLIRNRLRNPHRVSLDTVYRQYLKVPEPRMLHISAPVRRLLLRALGTPERRDSKSMLRYFAAISDVKNCGLALRLPEWNYAMAFASRYVRRTTEAEAETTLKLWSEMERNGGIKGNEVTFNILFDVASKSGNFALAEMIYKEMDARQIKFNRYHHVSLIHYFGLKMDGDGVRAAYREMVNAGEVIDTVVLNCVISGLLKSGEESAAEEVYERMKAGREGEGLPNPPQRDYIPNKVVTKVLLLLGKVGRSHPSLRRKFQKLAPLSPDLQTYRILVNHFALKTGNLAKVAQYLDEMKWFQVPLHDSIFLALFKGFAVHGGFSGATWSEQRLRSVLTALLDALDEGVKDLQIEMWLAMWILRAFKKCTTPEATKDTYDLLLERMCLTESQEGFMEDFLCDLLSDKDLSVYKRSVP